MIIKNFLKHFRYDGLYTVVENWVGVSPDSTKHRKFVLVRVTDQDPPPWIEKSSKKSKIFGLKKSSSPRLTRSLSTKISQKRKKTKFVYSKVQKEPKENSVSSIVSRQVFQKSVPESRDSSPKSASSTDSSQSLCQNLCQAKLCNTNLSIRTNFYDSSHNLQEVRKSNMTFNRIFKPSPVKQKNLSEKSFMMSSEVSHKDSKCINKGLEKEEKSVSWTNSNDPIEKSKLAEKDSNCIESNSIAVLSPSLSSVLKCKEDTERLSPVPKTKTNNLEPFITSNLQPTVNGKSKKSINETSTSINSLAPDKLVNALMKEKFHPMAKLIIGNMIGSENQESAILTAYNTLTSKIETDSSVLKPKICSKFFLKNNSRKNRVLKRQHRDREIANLTISAKFDATPAGKSRNRRLRALKRRISKAEVAQRSRRMPTKNLNKEISVKSCIESQQPRKKPEKLQEQPKKIEVKQQTPRMINKSVQCSLIGQSIVHRTVQVGNSWVETMNMKEELEDVDTLKEEFYDAESVNNFVPTGFCQPLTIR